MEEKGNKNDKRLFGEIAEEFGEAVRDIIMGCDFKKIRELKGGIDLRDKSVKNFVRRKKITQNIAGLWGAESENYLPPRRHQTATITSASGFPESWHNLFGI